MRLRRIIRGKENNRDADRKLREIAAGLDLPNPFSIERLCDAISKKRGRPLYLHAVDRGTAEQVPCGVWLATDIGDHVFVEESTSELHRSHIILHELCHMLLKHSFVPDPNSPDSRAITANSSFSNISMETISSMLGRTSYTTRDEQEAEALAGLIAGRVQAAKEDPAASDDRLVAHLLHALREA
ncbi:hypothetical protein [Kitasatospora sp. HPMI-4]|uniref:hypothetical protein n=1 Tax=Kitasatospora sp. HPMI-4 TaxID=3448443 RepID=UPI003F1DA530